MPVWNGLTDVDHPTQVLADFLTLRENFGHLKGLNLTYVGDGRNNMSNALMIGCAKMGINYTVGAPRELFPAPALLERCREVARAGGAEIRVVDEPKAAVRGADAVYTDVWVSMGEEDQKETRYKLLSPWQVNAGLMEAVGSDKAVFLHCLPAVKEAEVTEEVFEAPYSKVFDEAENRMHTIKAVMVATIGA